MVLRIRTLKRRRPEDRHISARRYVFVANEDGTDIEPHAPSFEKTRHRLSRSRVVWYLCYKGWATDMAGL